VGSIGFVVGLILVRRGARWRAGWGHFGTFWDKGAVDRTQGAARNRSARWRATEVALRLPARARRRSSCRSCASSIPTRRAARQGAAGAQRALGRWGKGLENRRK